MNVQEYNQALESFEKEGNQLEGEIRALLPELERRAIKLNALREQARAILSGVEGGTVEMRRFRYRIEDIGKMCASTLQYVGHVQKME